MDCEEGKHDFLPRFPKEALQIVAKCLPPKCRLNFIIWNKSIMRVIGMKMVIETRMNAMKESPALERERADFSRLSGYNRNVHRALFFYHLSYNLKGEKYWCMRRVARKFKIRTDDLWTLWCWEMEPFDEKWITKFGPIYLTNGKCIPVFQEGEPEAYDSSESDEDY